MRKITMAMVTSALLSPHFYAQSAVAGSGASSWVVDQYTKSRLFVGNYDKENKILHLGWQVSLKEGWKTYWRSPGDAGLPPRWTWKKNKNISEISVNWPAPELYNIFDLDTYIYHDEVVLPIDVKVTDDGEPLSIALDMEYMICEEICIPLTGSYIINVNSIAEMKASRFQKAMLNRYRDQVPIRVSGDETIVQMDKSGEQDLHISLPKEYVNVDNIIVEGPDGVLFGRVVPISETQFKVSHDAEKSLVGRNLTLTLLGEKIQGREMLVTVQP